MSGTTSRLGLETLATDFTDSVDEYLLAINNHAAKLDTAALFLSGATSSRPSAGFAGRIYQTTDALESLFVDDGTQWTQITASPWTAITAATGISSVGSALGYSGPPTARIDPGGAIRLMGTIRNVSGSTITSGTLLGTLPLLTAFIPPAGARAAGAVVIHPGTAALLTLVPTAGLSGGTGLFLSVSLANNGEIPLDHLSFP